MQQCKCDIWADPKLGLTENHSDVIDIGTWLILNIDLERSHPV